ncbi:MAG: dTDP-glucose 4,6-dehydratase [Candidatus Doudnabacteria bacterium RIFCSPHIGHO2_01_FULL_50_11]|uniref:dTDP-glucose 4,6-dehydratase n=1 Tax=Candidatus Doudnabacteria bacterium RIFCSPHIGHO2_01_FULL_50_11 TaxID=1817828 RepID=A0A1F5PE65_9BACT|nr:MAG: dTDP-glucose 4,6-dehydratase [Candidatus Doudnabacteria bacterium RIFCSPHIGHO2_01_FULL_50_11]HLC44617.1 dTDP-glucose 4,6-dehydratase [Patescibacteria group bacterium]
MRLLVTGGSGFIGSNFIHYWMDVHPDDSLVNLDKLTYAGNPANLRDIEGSENYQFIHGDICDEKIAEQAMRGCDAVVHFAAESHVDRSILSPHDFVRTNVLGTHVLLETARKLKIGRFHHVSTDEVFGSLPLGSREHWTENTAYNPRSPYAASKAGADHLVRAYHTTYGLAATISNCANNVGPYMFPEKLIPLAITNLLEGKKVPVYTPGNQVREWLYVTDHCRAIDLILQKGSLGETYFVGPDNPEYTNLEIVKKILGTMKLPETQIEFVTDRPGHDQRYALDWTKIKTELGWEPEVNLDSALKQTVDWYSNNQDWWKQVKSGEYQKYYQKQYGRSL